MPDQGGEVGGVPGTRTRQEKLESCWGLSNYADLGGMYYGTVQVMLFTRCRLNVGPLRANIQSTSGESLGFAGIGPVC